MLPYDFLKPINRIYTLAMNSQAFSQSCLIVNRCPVDLFLLNELGRCSNRSVLSSMSYSAMGKQAEGELQ